MIIWLILQGMVFAVWAWWAFRCLFRLRAQAVAETGLIVPGMRVTLRVFRGFVHLPEYRRDRLILLGLTVLLWVMIAGFALIRAA